MNHFPYGVDFGYLYISDYPPSYGENGGDLRIQPVDNDQVYFNYTNQFTNRVDCCNYAMSFGLTAWGYFIPASTNSPFFYSGYNACYVLSVKDKQSCQPRKVDYTMLSSKGPDVKAGGYYAL